ncbi:30S ribosomal protein S6 [Bythopirellula polymerisocia]|uniref:30S ribosomal protein S6 n=1 Tax=Bythopirellula polymerisocia TaxID=2528003 RepID=UPI0018D49941|nr:30S ribosomal protein S6 [Bythopirellula polymerisocia]
MEENIGVYEGLFILDANAYARDHDGLAQEVNGLIEAAGGHIEVSRLWEERRLAYPIKGHRKGAYWITYFRMPTSNLTGLTRECEIQDNILRQLFIRLPGALVEPILEHARGGGVVRAVPVSDKEDDNENAEEEIEEEEVGV